MNKHRRARQGAAAGSSDGAVSSRLEGTPASPSARTFARTSSGGLGGHGEQRCSNTRCQPRSRRGCPCPDLSGPPCSHARAPGLGTAGGCGIAMLAARRLRFRGRRSLGNHGASGVTGHHAGVLGFRVDGRSRRAVSGVRRKGAVAAVLDRRHLAERLSANRRTDTAARAATRERERFRALLVGGRCSSSASSCSPFTRRVETAAWGLRGGCRCKAGPVAKPGAPEARWANAPPDRERRSGARTAGRSG
jgi:hypothetical protein